MSNKKIKFIAVIILQILVILGIVLFKNSVITNGAEVFLRIEPVDPKDPLRGDFITFKFTDLSEISYFSDGRFSKGDIVYIPISENNDNFWSRDFYYQQQGTYVSEEKPNRGVFLKGAVQETRDQEEIKDAFDDSEKTQYGYITVTYGVEDYFIPEGKGQNLDFSGGDNYARVIVDADGNAVLEGIIVGGKEF